MRPHRRQPTRLLCTWDSPVKNTEVGCRFHLQCMCVCCRFSHVQLCATLWTAAHQAPLSTGFSRQEYWSGLPFPSPPWHYLLSLLQKYANFYLMWNTILCFPCSSVGKEFACSPRDPGSIPGLGRSPGEGNGHPLQYPCLENFMDTWAWWAAVHGVPKTWAWLSD